MCNLGTCAYLYINIGGKHVQSRYIFISIYKHRGQTCAISVHMHIYVYIYMCVCVYIYIWTHQCRQTGIKYANISGRTSQPISHGIVVALHSKDWDTCKMGWLRHDQWRHEDMIPAVKMWIESTQLVDLGADVHPNCGMELVWNLYGSIVGALCASPRRE